MAMDLSQLLSGLSNPTFKSFAGNALSDLGYGLTRGKNLNEGFQLATQRTAEMDPLRTADAEKRQMAEESITARNKTAAYLRSQPGGAQFADAIENGMIDGSTAFKSWLDASKGPDPTASMRDFQFAQENPGYAEFLNPPSKGPDPTASMRDFQFAQENPGYAEFLNPPPAAGGDLPSSVQEYEYAKAQGYTGSLLDFQKAKSSAGRAQMNPTTQKELFEAEDAAKAGDYVLSALDEAILLNDKAYDGPFADVRGDTTALLGDEAGVATARLKNVTTELALSQLKTIFGSMPTEGERKILLELQGSVNQAKPVRAAILKRAREMAERRIKDSKAKADALRSGAYFEEGYGQPAAGGDADVDAILQQYEVP